MNDRIEGARVVLLGVDPPLQSGWLAAAAAAGAQASLAATTREAAPSLANQPSVLLVDSLARYEPRCADPTDREFGAAAIAVLLGEGRISPWYGVAWDTIERNSPVAESVALLKAGLVESRSRLAERQMVADYHRRRASLTEKENAVLAAICNGRLNKQIARDLSVSIRTIEERRRRVFEKMGVDSAVPLAKLAAVVETLEDKAQRFRRRVDAAESPRRVRATRPIATWIDATLNGQYGPTSVTD